MICIPTPADVREPNEVALGSIPSSVNLPLSTFEKNLSMDEGASCGVVSAFGTVVPPYAEPLFRASYAAFGQLTNPSAPPLRRRLYARERLPQAEQAAADDLLLPLGRSRSDRHRLGQGRRLQVVSLVAPCLQLFLGERASSTRRLYRLSCD